MNKETATFALGCFWHGDEYFSKVPGVIGTVVGFTGGKDEKPSYQLVCGGGTGHAEAVQIEFDPSKISYRELVEKFFAEHDPTQLNRQGPDVGEQYRSAIFYHSEEQKKTAEGVRDSLQMSGRLARSIVTAIEPAGQFYPAEDYHQKCISSQSRDPTCG